MAAEAYVLIVEGLVSDQAIHVVTDVGPPKVRRPPKDWLGELQRRPPPALSLLGKGRAPSFF